MLKTGRNFFAVLLLSAAFAGASYADMRFANSMLRAGDDFMYSKQMVKGTLCDIVGRVYASGSAPEEDRFEYYQGRDTVYVVFYDGHSSKFVHFKTKDPRYDLAGVKVGDPISKVTAPGVVEGKYELTEGIARLHIWIRLTDYDEDTIAVKEADGRISEVSRFWASSLPDGGKMNWDLTGYLE